MDHAPLHAPLSLEPDRMRAGEVDLTGLELAGGVAGLIRRVAADTDECAEILDELFGDVLLPDGNCGPDTAPALRFVTRLAGPGLPAPRRLDVALWLLYASDRRADSLISGRSSQAPAPWTEDVHRAIGAELPALLAGWPDQPPAVQYALAGLAALHRDAGLVVADEVVSLAAEHADSVQGAYLAIAAALVAGDDERALELADAILSWDEDIAPEWVTAPGVDAAMRAGHVLAEGMQHTAR